MKCRRMLRASSISGSPPAAVPISILWPFLAMSDALATTSGVELRMALLSSRLAPFSPASAFSERIRSSLSFATVSSENSSSSGTLAPPFPLVSPVPAIDERGVTEDFRNFTQLYDRSDEGFDAHPLEPHPGGVDLAFLPLSLIEASGQLANEAATDVLADYAAIDLAAPGVVASAPFAVLPAHRYEPLRMRRAWE